MTRTERLDLLLRTLRDRPGITTREIGDLLGASPRSVFRDIALLRDRGYPIESSRGRGGGLRLHPNWGLSRVLLSAEEAIGVLLSLAVTEQLGVPMFGTGLGRARRKVVDAFPLPERRLLAPLRERIFVGPPASRPVAASYRRPDPAAARNLQQAFVHEHLVTGLYTREDGNRSERRLEPHAVLLNWPAWYLLALDHSRAAVRTFRLDRFLSIREEMVRFRPRPREVLGAIAGLEADQPGTWRL